MICLQSYEIILNSQFSILNFNVIKHEKRTLCKLRVTISHLLPRISYLLPLTSHFSLLIIFLLVALHVFPIGRQGWRTLVGLQIQLRNF